VLQGLKPDDWIVLNPPDSLEEGLQVNVKEMPQTAPMGMTQPPQGAAGQSSGEARAKQRGSSTPSGNKQ
jgi:hypothetical protein